MATAPTGTLLASGPGVTHEKEDLSDVIARIDPSEVPVFSGLTKCSATSIKHEWTVQELAAVDGSNAQPEGADPDFDTLKVPARFDNFTQISTRAGVVSGTYDSLDTAGGSDRESTRQKVLSALELRRDLELIITQFQVKKGTDARTGGSIAAYLDDAHTIENDGTTGDGTGAVLPVMGTPVAFDSVAKLDEALLAAYLTGGKPKVAYLSPFLKTQFSKLPDATAGAGSVYVTKADSSKSQFQFIGAADVYHSDWGPIEIAPSIHMLAGVIYCLDPNYIKYASLPGRSFMSENLAKTGDNTKYEIVNEGCIQMTAGKASSMIMDLATS